MRFRSHHLLPAGIAAIVLAAGTAEAFTHDPAIHDLEFPLVYDSTLPVYQTVKLETTGFGRAVSLGSGWLVQPNWRTGTVHFAYGGDLFLAPAVLDRDQAASLARDFLLAQPELLGTRPDNLQLRNVFEYRGKYAVHFQQTLGDVPVYHGDAFVVVDQSGRVMAFGSDFFPDRSDIPAHARLSEAAAIDAAARALGATPRADRPATAEAVLVPAPSGELLELAIAWKVVFESYEPFGMWESYVDGTTGEVLGRSNLYHFVNVLGNVAGDVEDFGYCDGSAVQGLENLTVNVSGGNSGDTNDSGDFDISHGGTADVTVDAQFLGPFLDVNRFSGLGADASFSGTATPGTPLQITFDQSNSRRDERDAFFHGNRVHDFMTAIDPSFTSLDYAMPTVVGRNDFVCPCNAWWDGTGMNYCRQDTGANCANTARIGNVVYHEYGHGVSQEWYIDNGASLPSGDMHEGNSDIIANFIDRNPFIGLGFFIDVCGSGIRNADNSLQWPQDNDGGHSGGQIIAGFHWDSWQSLLAVKPQAEADSIAWSTWHFGRGMGTPLNQADQVLWTFIADDDDGNLNNGTPNYDHFCLGASNHGFTCPEILVGVIITHTRLGHTTDDVNGYDVVATIISTEGALDPNELKVIYRVNGGVDTELLMGATGNPDEYSATIPAQNQHSEVEYYISAMDILANSRTDPPLAPAQRHAFDVAQVYDDLEAGVAGWTVGLPSDDATTGDWELADPIGTQAQPADDSTPAPGVLAFITGQCSGPNCGGGCTLGCNDVDGGSTTLLTPVYDLSGAVQAMVKYDRWYSNNTGATPGTDFWVVDVSNDGGATWTNVENTNASNASWSTVSIDIDALFGTPDQVQVRFIGSDLGSGSLVEAGVDEIRVLADFGATAAEVLPQASAAFSLSQNQPNPFRPATRIEFSVPERSAVDLTVYNVRGQVVRHLARGAHKAGHHSVRWDGRDSEGRQVAAGVYFYRLQAGERTLTRKMTVTK